MAPRILFARPAAALRRVPRPLARPSSRSYAAKPPSITSQFYKTFTRPIAKVLLVAVFTYQVVYWAWVKLETDETQAETEATIASLEAKVGEYQDSTALVQKSESGKSSPKAL